MDWTTIITSIIIAISSIGAVVAFNSKNMPSIAKWITLAKDAVETLSDLSSSLAKGALTSAEIAQLQTDVTQFQADLKLALGK